MLNYSKIILGKVIFDPILFQKELNKALNLLDEKEGKQLLEWSMDTFKLPKEYIAPLRAA